MSAAFHEASFSRRAFFAFSASAAACVAAPGCAEQGAQAGDLDLIWGRRGMLPGKFFKPRAITIDSQDQLYIVDITPRIQVFTPDGEFIRGWQTPEFANGKPSGLAFDNAGNLLVADTHYFRMLVYTPAGKLLENRSIGGQCGLGPGEFNFVTDCAQDRQGNYYIAEYGEFDRIQKFTPDGLFVMQWGGHGRNLGQFLRPQKMQFDAAGLLWVADACNHRVQVFDVSGSQAQLVQHWGKEGTAPGELRYPYDILLDGQGHVYLCEFGNHRVQKFTLDGQFVGSWGRNGRREGELVQPWGITRDSSGRMYVLDSYNHRVQRFLL